MWIIQEPNTLELWNKLHFEEKKRRVYTMFKIFSTNICWINIQNVNNTGTKYVRIMKQTAFWRGKNGECIPRLKYSVPIFVEQIYKMWIIQEPNTLGFWNKLHFEEKKRRVYTVFKIFGCSICWINI